MCQMENENVEIIIRKKKLEDKSERECHTIIWQNNKTKIWERNKLFYYWSLLSLRISIHESNNK